MIKITKKLKINEYKPKVFPVYTDIEADELGILYKHWQDCGPGEFGLSDDNYVSECIARNNYKSNNFSTVSTKSYGELEAQTGRADLAVTAYLTYKMAGLSPDMHKIGSIYRPDQKNPVIAAKRLFKTKEAKKMIEEKLKEILTDKKIDEGFVLDTIKDAIEVAKVKESSADMIRAAKELSIFLDMAPKQKQVTDTLEIDMTSQIQDNYEKQRKKLKATKVQDVDTNFGEE